MVSNHAALQPEVSRLEFQGYKLLMMCCAEADQWLAHCRPVGQHKRGKE